MPGPSREVAAWVTSPAGLELLGMVTERLEHASVLEVGSGLREGGLDPGRAAALTSMATARIRSRARYPEADRLVFTPELLEQASHPAVASWRSRRFGGADHIVDLCCGAGSDAMALARHAPVLAVDRDPATAVLAAHNLQATGGPHQTIVADASVPLTSPGTPVHADPARRTARGRVHHLRDYRPAVPGLAAVIRRAGAGGITVSPAVPLDDPDLGFGGELEFVQVGDDLVEAVIWIGDLAAGDRCATATLLDQDGGQIASIRRVGEEQRLPVGEVGEWLVEPAPAIVRARLHDRLGRSIGAHRIADRRALLTTGSDPGRSPLYRPWRVETVLPVRDRDIRSWLRTAQELPLEISTHGLDVDPEGMLTRLGSPPRGPQGRRLHLIRLDRGAVAIATRAG